MTCELFVERRMVVPYCPCLDSLWTKEDIRLEASFAGECIMLQADQNEYIYNIIYNNIYNIIYVYNIMYNNL